MKKFSVAILFIITKSYMWLHCTDQEAVIRTNISTR